MLAYLFVVLAVAFRFLPVLNLSPFHFTPIAASLLFFGAHAPRRRAWIPLALLTVTDLALNRYFYDYPFRADQLVTIAWYAGAIGIGMLLRRAVTPARVVGASLAASVSFFVVSNFMVWVSYAMYPMTAAGLLACYAAAVPFFRNTVAGDLLFSAVLFSIPALRTMGHAEALPVAEKAPAKERL